MRKEKKKTSNAIKILHGRYIKDDPERCASVEREKINAYKESLSPEQRSELREKALDEIKKLENIREELISEVLIEAKENEILRNKL